MESRISITFRELNQIIEEFWELECDAYSRSALSFCDYIFRKHGGRSPSKENEIQQDADKIEKAPPIPYDFMNWTER